uniref:Uncharacterized protein n=1 Tax=Oryza barthii TaxID=65489 RepID=A0A0D3GYU4_9ORYZ
MLLDEESLSDGEEEFIFSAVDIVHGEFDDDEVPKRGGSVLGHAVINRERLAGQDCIMIIFPKNLRTSMFSLDADKEVHNQLREGLIEHLWNHHADQY